MNRVLGPAITFLTGSIGLGVGLGNFYGGDLHGYTIWQAILGGMLIGMAIAQWLTYAVDRYVAGAEKP